MNHRIEIKKILTAQLVSSIGDQITLLASFAALLSVTGDPLKAATPLLIRGIIHLFFGLFSMHFIDKYAAKWICVLADIIRFLLVGMIVLNPAPDAVFILSIQAMCTVIEIFFNSAREKTISAHIDSLPSEDQRRFVALDNQIYTLTEILGFALGAVLVAGLNYKLAFGIDAFSFLMSGVFILFSTDISAKSASKQSTFELISIKEGFAATLKNPDLLWSTFSRSIFWIGAGIFNVAMLKIMTSTSLGLGSASGVGLMRVLEAVGFALGLRWVEKRMSGVTGQNEILKLFKSSSIGLILAGLSTFALLPSRLLLFLSLAFFVHGIGTGFNSFGVRRIRQLGTIAIPQLRGRVTALSNTLAKTSEVFGMLLLTFLGSQGEVQFNFGVCVSGLSFILAALVCWRRGGNGR